MYVRTRFIWLFLLIFIAVRSVRSEQIEDDLNLDDTTPETNDDEQPYIPADEVFEAVSSEPPQLDPTSTDDETNKQTDQNEPENLPNTIKFDPKTDYSLEELKDLTNFDDLNSNPPNLLLKLSWNLLFSGKESNQKQAFTIFKHLADNYGMPSAQHALAFQYLNGIGIDDVENEDGKEENLETSNINEDSIIENDKQNLSKSLVFQTFASLGGDERAKQSLAFQYLSGLGVKKDCEKALLYYEQVASEVIDREKGKGGTTLANRYNEAMAKYRVKIYEYEDPSIETSAEVDDDSTVEKLMLDMKFKSMHESNDMTSNMNFGQIYMNGLFGFKKDLKKAEAAFKKVSSSHLQYPLALAFLGKIYLDGGDGIPQDYSKAKQYLDKATEKNSFVAKTYLGIMYLNGWGVDKNIAHAQNLLEQSAKNGWFEARLHLGQLYYDGTLGGNQLKNYQKAMQQFAAAAEFGSLTAKYYMAKMHAKGLGAVRHCSTAVGLFKEFVEGGDTDAIKLWKDAFTKYSSGDYNGALIIYTYLADLGFEVAQINAADIIYSKNGGINSDGSTFIQRAKFNWERAADQGGKCASQSILNLGDYYYYQENDYEKAKVQYRSACDTYENPQAAFNLGYMHQYGLGLPKDLHLAKRYYDKSLKFESDGAIPVFLALNKLFIDLFIEKCQNYFYSASVPEWLIPYNILQAFTLTDAEIFLSKYLGSKYDVIIGVILIFLFVFGLAWRRQNRLRYNRARLEEILRLQSVQEEENKVEEEMKKDDKNESLNEGGEGDNDLEKVD